jgi:hypothetical protein
VPLIEQRALRDRTRAQPVRVAHDLEHVFDHTRRRRASSARGVRNATLRSPQLVAQPWRVSNTMSRINGTCRGLPYLPMAEARGFSGAC